MSNSSWIDCSRDIASHRFNDLTLRKFFPFALFILAFTLLLFRTRIKINRFDSDYEGTGVDMVIEHVWCKSSVRWACGYNERFAVPSVSLRAIRIRRVGCGRCCRSWIRCAADRLYPYTLRNFCNLRRIFIVSETRIESTTWSVTAKPLEIPWNSCALYLWNSDGMLSCERRRR